MSRPLNIILNLASVALVAAGVVLVASIFLPPFWAPSPTLEAGSSEVGQVSDTAESGGETGEQKAEKTGEDGGDSGDAPDANGSGGPPETPEAPVAPEAPAPSEKPESEKSKEEAGPKDKTLRVSVPEMGRVEDDRVPNTNGKDGAALKKNVAIHLEGTGYPWEKEANVYMAGHRIGYPGTDSFLGFYDLNKLEQGDEIEVEDSNGKSYTYRVYREEIVAPDNLEVTRPQEGRNILTLQTCTLPNYTQRMIVQAEKVS